MRQLDAALGAPEQRDPQLFLEQTHLVAERRLSDAGTASRTGEVQFLGDSDEVTQLAKIHSSIIAKKKNGGDRSPPSLDAFRPEALLALRLAFRSEERRVGQAGVYLSLPRRCRVRHLTGRTIRV